MYYVQDEHKWSCLVFSGSILALSLAVILWSGQKLHLLRMDRTKATALVIAEQRAPGLACVEQSAFRFDVPLWRTPKGSTAIDTVSTQDVRNIYQKTYQSFSMQG